MKSRHIYIANLTTTQSTGYTKSDRHRPLDIAYIKVLMDFYIRLFHIRQ